MSEFCEKKGIKKEFSVARTPQQNGVAERRNRTLIEAARTMLADSKLPTTFWAEVVNTACYVQNRVLVVKPHNKTPYELFRGRTPALSFMRPFGCHVTILNTLDYLGKFDGKPGNSTQVVHTVEPSINTEPDLISLGYNDTLEATHANFFGDETEVDMTNITTTYPVPFTLKTRIHKDHSLDHVISDVQSGVQTRRMTNKQGFISDVYEGKTLEDLHTCLFGCFLSQEEPKRIAKALSDIAWVEAMQEELLHFKLQKVYIVVDLPKDGVSELSFMVGLNRRGKIDQTLFIKKQKGDILLLQMSSMGELTFFLGLQVKQKEDGIFISQDKYVAEILRKFSFTDVRTASTPIDTEKPLLKDSDGDDVDVHLYRSMFGSLIYLTSSRPDIMFVVCACARFQVTPKVSHLHAVKRIFRLISWQCRKQTVVATSSTEAEYVAAASCYGQVLWIQNQILDYGYALTANPTIYVSLIKQFWQTATAKILDNGEIELTATIDGTGPVVQSEGSTHPVESHHTPISAPSTSQPPISPTSRRTTRQESVVPQPRSLTQTPVADDAASTGVDVRYRGAAMTVTSLEAG
ncbi:putative ribonuclease H-like domain-containing protein [Tanacetum coccineum]